MKNKILLILAHPLFHKSRINKTLIREIRDLEGVYYHNIYEEYPDFHIDIIKEQKLLLEHDIIIWQHPFYWYSAPSILKEWIDLVLEHGFAYGKEGNALKGKYVMSAVSTGGRREAYQPGAYNRYSIRQFLAPFDRTVELCKMNYLPPFVVHGSHLLNAQDLKKITADYKNIIISLRDKLFNVEEVTLIRKVYNNNHFGNTSYAKDKASPF